jgi:lysophospholipase L1-like esterase
MIPSTKAAQTGAGVNMTKDWLSSALVVIAASSSGLTACGGPASDDGASTDAASSSGSDTEAPPQDTSAGPGSGGLDTSSGGMEGGSGSEGSTTAPPDPTDTGDDTTTGDPGVCQPIPTRMVVLGDSIAACAVVGGKDSDDCGPKRLNDHLAANYGPLTYENLAVGGAVTSDVPQYQLPDIEVGIPGHVLVMIYVGGNDLAAYIFGSDQAAIDGWNDTTGPEVAAAWEETLVFLGDPANFPDGVTLLMNTQYNPFDDCTAPPYFVSETKIELLHAHNEALVDRAGSQPWGFIADQHPSYLGHGHFVNDSGCPHYDESFDGWMGDLIHPNALGHHHLADVMAEVVDLEIYGACE